MCTAKHAMLRRLTCIRHMQHAFVQLLRLTSDTVLMTAAGAHVIYADGSKWLRLRWTLQLLPRAVLHDRPARERMQQISKCVIWVVVLKLGLGQRLAVQRAQHGGPQELQQCRAVREDNSAITL